VVAFPTRPDLPDFAELPELLGGRTRGDRENTGPIETAEGRLGLGREELARFSRLYATQAPRIHRFLRDLLFDETLAKDATQETFARSLNHTHVWQDESRAVPWLFGVARNVSLELRKERARRGRVMQDDPEGRAEAHARECPEADLLARDTARRLAAAMANLSEDRRALLLLRLDHGLGYEQIAESMGFSLAKVKVELFRAREALRAELASQETP
jgi:RNA polymerase sigma-70 factor (ECF subfamily)